MAMLILITLQTQMPNKTIISDELLDYAIKYGVHEHVVLKSLREYTHTLSNAQMQISPEQGQFMALLAKIINAKKYLEIGVFTGYSSLVMALAMGQDSSIYALDNNEAYVNTAKTYWEQVNVDKNITTVIGSALDSLEALHKEHDNTFDIAFIDANKSDYKAYYEHCLKLTKPNGVILIDNVLFHGQVLEDNPPKFVQAIKEFNDYIYNDSRVDISLLAIADGLTIARKKA